MNSTKAPKSRPSGRARGAGSSASRAELLARIKALEASLAQLRERVGSIDTTCLSTVKVPAQFELPFLRAQEYVARYFSDRVEHPDTATISIAGERYVLLRAASLSVEFVEMVMKLYQSKGTQEARRVANNLLFDLAHAIGKADARAFQQKMAVSDPIDNLSAGPIHFAFSGWAFVDISPNSRPAPDESYYLLYDHPFSFESHSWLTQRKQSDVPVCIMNAGYSSGWCEESFGLPLVAAEVECLAAGGDHCRFIMAPPSRIEEHIATYARSRGRRVGRAAGGHGGIIPEFFQRKRLEEELREANEGLERRAAERTHELKQANEQMRLLESAIENAAEGVVIMQYVGGADPLRVSFVNHGFSRITGYSADEMCGHSLRRLRLQGGGDEVLNALLDSVQRKQPFQGEVTALRPNGSAYALEIHVMPVPAGAGEADHWVAILRDVSDRKAHLDALKHQALHDALTGLPNRVLLLDRIERSILGMRRHGTSFALMFLDLDGFKEINDTFGHHTGDLLLTTVGERLRAHLHANDTIARLGGDEFAIVLDGLAESSVAAQIGRRLLAALLQPFEIEGHKLVVGASIGIVHCPEHGADPTTLMRHADVAMYAAKTAGAGTMVYDPQQDAHSPARIVLISELRTSIDDAHLVLHYQPEIELASGRVARAEALLRWKHPDRGLLLPDEFLPLVAQNELINQIGHWVLQTAIRDCREWIDVDLDVGVSVNLSPYNLRDRHLPEFIARVLAEAKLPPSRLTIEITESGILEQATLAADTFRLLRDIGVGLSIDDFGTGYSSLMHLKHLPFTELKVDRAFTNELLVNKHDAAIVRSTIDLGHELGRSIVAEGVETRGVLERLRKYRCDFVQGNFISPPMDKAALREWLIAPPAFAPGR